MISLNQGLKTIDYGKGTISPKLWGYSEPQEPNGKKKRKGSKLNSTFYFPPKIGQKKLFSQKFLVTLKIL